MDAQGFDIMPLVDAPRIRTNVNDMTARAVYAKNGGEITHLAQRSGDSVEFFPLDQILTVNENESIFHALDALCSHMLEHPSTPFVLMVVDSNNNPTALFSLRELLSRRLNDAILSTILDILRSRQETLRRRAKRSMTCLSCSKNCRKPTKIIGTTGMRVLEKQKPLHCFVLLFPSSFACSQMQQYRCLDGDNRLQERMTLMSI